ncbi:MAG TPA: energy transducer TonB [Candidatus Solibacter sp.]|nr:energy transducer TonB [Candidatus Solibacter sp.]
MLLVSILTSVGFAQTNRVDQTGYIYCAKGSPESTVSAFLTACLKVPVGNFSCGDKVEVIGRSGSALEILRPSGPSVFLKSDVVSQKADEYLPIELESKTAPDCTPKEHPELDRSKNHPPRPVFQPQPEYPKHAPRTGEVKTVSLSLVVGLDGKPHDIKVQYVPSKDFAQNAEEAVKRWRFEPGLKNGQPVEMPITIEMTFRIF